LLLTIIDLTASFIFVRSLTHSLTHSLSSRLSLLSLSLSLLCLESGGWEGRDQQQDPIGCWGSEHRVPVDTASLAGEGEFHSDREVPLFPPEREEGFINISQNVLYTPPTPPPVIWCVVLFENRRSAFEQRSSREGLMGVTQRRFHESGGNRLLTGVCVSSMGVRASELTAD